jgi:hypothetical protein
MVACRNKLVSQAGPFCTSVQQRGFIMRKWNLLAAAAVVGLLAELSFGLINVKLVADQTALAPGQTTTVHILGEAVGAGLFSLAGDVVASGTPGGLSANPGSFMWMPDFNPVPMGNLYARLGTPADNGGWIGFGSVQTERVTDYYFARDSFVELASYAVTAQTVAGSVSLTFVGRTYSGFVPLATDGTKNLGTITPVTISIVPDPATLALLAVGGLLIGRRRRA